MLRSRTTLAGAAAATALLRGGARNPRALPPSVRDTR
jgi:hypothetical protein